MSFSSANFINLTDRSSRASPVRPKRVLTSPTAVPAVAKSVGMVLAMFRVLSCMSCRASPVAPVFFVTMSRPSSTSFHATTDAAPTPMIGAVTDLVSVPPRLCILPPTSLSFSPHSLSCAECPSICFVTSFRASSYLFREALQLLISAFFFAIAASSRSSAFSICSSCAWRICSFFVYSSVIFWRYF